LEESAYLTVIYQVTLGLIGLGTPYIASFHGRCPLSGIKIYSNKNIFYSNKTTVIKIVKVDFCGNFLVIGMFF